MIDVEQGDGERLAEPLAPLPFARELRVQVTAIVDAGERILEGQTLEQERLFGESPQQARVTLVQREKRLVALAQRSGVALRLLDGALHHRRAHLLTDLSASRHLLGLVHPLVMV